MAKKSIDDLFREPEFEDFGGPSPELWRRLETRLEDRKRAQKRRRRIRFLQIGAVGLTVFLLGLAAAFVVHLQRKSEQKRLETPPVLIDSLRLDSIGR